MKKLTLFLLAIYWIFAIYRFYEPYLPLKITLPKFSGYLFPPDYKMFVGPYNSDVYAEYTFYNQSNQEVKINSNDFLNQQIKKELPLSNTTFRFSIGLDKSFIYLNDIYMDEYKKAFNKNMSLNLIHESFIKNIKKDSFAIEFIKVVNNFSLYIIERNSNLNNTYKCKVQIFRAPILLNYYTPNINSKNDLTYSIGKKLLYEKTFILK